jgi:hypothetical protein
MIQNRLSNSLRWSANRENQPGAGGWIYFIQCEGFVKIGQTRKMVKSRIIELQTGNPFPLKLVGILKTDNMDRDEKKIHSMFRRYRVRRRGEWFAFVQEIKDFVSLSAFSDL